MHHVLDNPAWNALISGNKNLSNGNETVKYFAKGVSPFVGLKEHSAENFKSLHDLIPRERIIGLIMLVEMEIPGQWKVLHCIRGFQMVYNGDTTPDEQVSALTPLTDDHIPQMVALTKLTNPGPFASRTIDFGHYQGIFDDGKLVAMAGQRMHASPYTEVSAVCTHPDHTGKGYARQLIMHQVQRMKAVSAIPFLHVRHNNERAIKVYEDLGFTTRTAVYFYFIQKI